MQNDISSCYTAVLGQPMHYLEAGSGRTLLFLHGNPTSSYLWRNVLPIVSQQARCIALDLIGMGRSSKPRIAYRLQDHIAYVEAFITTLGLTDITFVLHDWGVAIGLDYLRRHPEQVRAVAFMEGHLHPIEQWGDLDAGAQTMFQQLRTEDTGRTMIIDENFFIETVLPSGILRTLSEEERDAYRAPYLHPQDREPLWQWPREIPIAGDPADVHTLVAAYKDALAHSAIPKLLFVAEPGAVIGAAEIAWCQQHLSHLTINQLGPGLHFLPEDHPQAIGEAISAWMKRG